MRQTTIVKHLEVTKKWYLIDANNVVLGRLAAKVASILRGKHLPTFTPNVDMGDNIIIINADKVLLTAKKENDKVYYRHSGYPGGLRSEKASDVRKRKPTFLVKSAVYGMLPKSKLGRKQRTNLYVYVGSEHKHEAQKPEIIGVN